MRASRVNLAAVLLGGALLCWGCDPGAQVSGSVRRATGEPVQGASVALSCPSSQRYSVRTDTDHRGLFEFPRKLGCLESDCVVTVQNPSGVKKSFAVEQHCAYRHYACRRGCSRVEVHATF